MIVMNVSCYTGLSEMIRPSWWWWESGHYCFDCSSDDV